MLMDSVTTVFHGVTPPPKPDSETELKSEEHTDEVDSDEVDSDEEDFIENHMPAECLEDYRRCKESDALYLERSRDPYNAIACPIRSLLGGSYYRFWVSDVTDKDNEDLPMLKDLSQTALLHFQQEHSGASFEFHKLVRCAYRLDSHPNKSPADRHPTEYYITFEAEGDPSNSSDIATFLATVLVNVVDKTKHVQECRIKTTTWGESKPGDLMGAVVS